MSNKHGIPEPYNHYDNGGHMLGDAMRPGLIPQNIQLVADGNNPPSVTVGTVFNLYDTYTASIKDRQNSNNTNYPRNQSNVKTLNHHTIWEQAARTFAWATGEFPAKANSTTYYLFCYKSKEGFVAYATRGQGEYGVTTTAPDYDVMKGGYGKELTLGAGTFFCKYLGRFETDGSGNVENIISYNNIGFISGDIVPDFAPPAVGIIYVDITNENSYISIDTVASSDWIQTNNVAATYDYEFEGDTAGSSKITIGYVNSGTIYIKVKKPIMAYVVYYKGGGGTGTITLLQNGAYRAWKSYSVNTTEYLVLMNPGRYKIYSGTSGNHITVVATGVASGELTTASIVET